MSGFIMCARQEVVHDDPMAAGVIIVGVDAHHSGNGIFGHGTSQIRTGILELERCRHDHLVGPGCQVAANAAAGMFDRQTRVQESAGGIHHQPHFVAVPADIGRISCFPQQSYADAIDIDGPLLFVHLADDRLGTMAVQKSMQCAICGVPFQVVGNIRERGPGLASNADHELIEGPPGNMVPDHQFTDTSQPVDAEFH